MSSRRALNCATARFDNSLDTFSMAVQLLEIILLAYPAYSMAENPSELENIEKALA